MRKTPGLSFAWPLLLLACGACGGGSGNATDRSGALALRAVWEQPATGGGAQFEGSTDLPAAVQTVEVRIDGGGESLRELVDPEQTRSVLITGVPTGRVEVTVLGYDVPLLGAPDLRDVAVAPSYASSPVEVLVSAGRTADAGQIEVLAQPFLTAFDPLPESSGVDPSRPVGFVLAIGVGGIDVSSVDVSVDGSVLVSAGVPAGNAFVELCADGTAAGCGPIDRGLSGIVFRGPLDGLPAQSTVDVRVNARGGPESSRSLDFAYSFETGGA
jgi:hypothetical protein